MYVQHLVLLLTILQWLSQLLPTWGPIFWFLPLCQPGVSNKPPRSTHTPHNRMGCEVMECSPLLSMVEVWTQHVFGNAKQMEARILNATSYNLFSFCDDKSPGLFSESRSELDPKYHFNGFISQAPVMVKTLDLAGFRLMSGGDTSADFRPYNRKFQDGQQSHFPYRM